ncbi:MAG: hypothetical protein JW885_10715 [Deltaproteobacteria bacterium]|nr:hypothetical protein [Candidatus Zymogenaceae bacterium]
MKRVVALLVVAALSLGVAAAAPSQDEELEAVSEAARDITDMYDRGTAISRELSKTVGIAVNPLLGLMVVGSYHYINAVRDGESVRWFYSPVFLILLAILLVLVGLNDTIGEAYPPSKKVLDGVALAQQYVLAALALAAIVPGLVEVLTQPVGEAVSSLFRFLGPGTAWAADGTGEGGGVGGIVGGIAVVVSSILAGGIFLMVWLASAVVEALTLISPVPFTGVVLKGLRLAVLAMLAVTAIISPILGLVAVLIVLYLAYRLAGWSMRMTVYGVVIVGDLLGNRAASVDDLRLLPVTAFAAREMEGVPRRSFGRLSCEGEFPVFRTRPWLVLPARRVVYPRAARELAAARGVWGPSVVEPTEGDASRTLFELPPRYRGHEEAVAEALGLSRQVTDLRVVARVTSAWRWVRAQFLPAEGTPIPEETTG